MTEISPKIDTTWRTTVMAKVALHVEPEIVKWVGTSAGPTRLILGYAFDPVEMVIDDLRSVNARIKEDADKQMRLEQLAWGDWFLSTPAVPKSIWLDTRVQVLTLRDTEHVLQALKSSSPPRLVLWLLGTRDFDRREITLPKETSILIVWTGQVYSNEKNNWVSVRESHWIEGGTESLFVKSPFQQQRPSEMALHSRSYGDQVAGHVYAENVKVSHVVFCVYSTNMTEISPKKDVSSMDFRGTLYVQITLPCSKELQAAVRKHVDQKDWCTDEAVTKGKPIETESHVTVKLGLDLDTPMEDIEAALSHVKPFSVRIGGLGVFSNSNTFGDGKVHERDVLFAKVDDFQGGLAKLRDALQPFELKDKSDAGRGYHPHVTLVFLRYEAGQSYVDNAQLVADAQVGELKVDHVSLKIVGDRSVKPIDVKL